MIWVLADPNSLEIFSDIVQLQQLNFQIYFLQLSQRDPLVSFSVRLGWRMNVNWLRMLEVCSIWNWNILFL